MANKPQNYSDISFIIPVKIDSTDREINLFAVCTYLKMKYMNSQIIIAECDKKSKLSTKIKSLENECFFLRSNRFSKSRTVNMALNKCKNEIICIWDADMFASPAAIEKAVNILNEGKFKLVVPHNQIYINLKKDFKQKFLENVDIGVTEWTSLNYFDKPTQNNYTDIFLCHGGFIVTKKSILNEVGGYNKNMTSYGWEDTEIILRYKKLYNNYCFLKDYSAVHLDHFRGIDSKQNEFYKLNYNEYLKIKQMKYKELKSYVNYNLKGNITTSKKLASYTEIPKLNKIKTRIIFYTNYINYINNVFGIKFFLNKLKF